MLRIARAATVSLTGAALVAAVLATAPAAQAATAAGMPGAVQARSFVVTGKAGLAPQTRRHLARKHTKKLVLRQSTSGATRTVVAGTVTATLKFSAKCAPLTLALIQNGTTLAKKSGASPVVASATVVSGSLTTKVTGKSCRTSYTLDVVNTPQSATEPAPVPAPTPSTTPSPAPSTSPSTGPMPEFGVQFHGTWGSYTDASRAMVLDTLKANGATSVRIDVSWAMLQPNGPGALDAWGSAQVDKAIRMAAERGLAPLVTLWLAPKWANGSTDERVPPTTQAGLDGFTAIARTLAATYKGVVIGWEVWNEPNSSDFMRGADPAVYARMLQAAYSGFKAGDAASTVVFGGPMYVDTPWVERALAAGAAGHYDVMGVHPYQGVADEAPELPDNGTIWRLNHLPTLIDAMARYGDGAKKIWFTEFGWSVHETWSGAANWQRGVTEAQQADYLARTIALVRSTYPQVTRVYWYKDRADTTDVVQGGYGLVWADGSVRPALAGLQAALRG